MSQVVKDLYLYAPIYQKSRWKDVSAYSFSPVNIVAENPATIVESEKIFFSFSQATLSVSMLGKKYPLNQWINTQWGKLKFVPTKNTYISNFPLYFSLINPQKITNQLANSIEVSPTGKLSSVITLTLKDEVPKRAENILNEVIFNYDRASLREKNNLALSTLKFLDERLAYVSFDLDSIEKALQQYRTQKGAIDLSSQGKMILQSVSETDQKLSGVNMQLAMLNQVEKYVTSKNTEGGIVPSTVGVSDPLLNSLIDKLYESELQYEKLKKTTGESNPQLTAIADRIQKIKPSILENIRSQKASLESNKSNLNITNNAFSSVLQSLPKQERDLVDINRQQNIKASIYSFLLQKREETALANSSILSDTRVVDNAQASFTPISLDNKKIYLIAIALAIFIGIVFINARELFNKNILYRKEIESKISFPVIAELAYIKGQKSIVVESGKYSQIAEEFRMLRTSLLYLGIEKNNKKILITSTIPEEGKSFVTLNLALSLAMSGKKVVIAEFDLSNPTLSNKLGLSNRGIGVADYLSGTATLEEIIIPLENYPNLYIATAGNLPKNPSELILSNRTDELLEYLVNNFDMVLVDSAPVGLMSDGYVLSRQCDATLYVMRHGHTPKKVLGRLEKNNRINYLNNIGIVFNGIKTRGFGKTDHGYGYNGYGYNYNYGNSKKIK
jgi:capsular exopolysaccharide synthesis family protein